MNTNKEHSTMSDTFYEAIIDSAKKHAENSNEPEHEIGDLQLALQACMDIMSDSQRKSLYLHLQDQEFFENYPRKD